MWNGSHSEGRSQNEITFSVMNCCVDPASERLHHVPRRPRLISKPVKTATLLTGHSYTMQCVFSGRSVPLLIIVSVAWSNLQRVITGPDLRGKRPQASHQQRATNQIDETVHFLFLSPEKNSLVVSCDRLVNNECRSTIHLVTSYATLPSLLMYSETKDWKRIAMSYFCANWYW